MSQKLNTAIAVIGIDIGKNSFHVVGLDDRGAIALRQKWSRGQVETRLANIPPCLIGMEACVGAHHLSRRLRMLGHDAKLMPAKYVRPYSKGQKNDFRDAEACFLPRHHQSQVTGRGKRANEMGSTGLGMMPIARPALRRRVARRQARQYGHVSIRSVRNAGLRSKEPLGRGN